MKNQRGFTLIEAMLIVIALTLISFAGWYVLNERNKDDEPTTKTVSPASDQDESAADETADWKLFSASDFSIKYPNDWFLPTNQDMCAAGDYFLAGPTQETAGLCDSDATAQVSIHTFTVESGPMGLTDESYDDIKTTSVTVDGVTGQRESGTFAPTEAWGIGPEAGSKMVEYTFKKGATYYNVSYVQQPSSPDAVKTFDLMVTKGLKFN